MRNWIKTGVRFAALATMLAGTGAAFAYSHGSADGSTLLTDRPGEPEGMAAMDGTGSAADGSQPGLRSAARSPIAGLAGLAITVIGAAMIIRRRRRRAAIQGEEL